MAGIPPWRFWALTRSELVCALRAFNSHRRHERDIAIVIAWRTATLSRSKKIPALSRLLRDPKRYSRAEQDAILADVRALDAEFDRLEAKRKEVPNGR